MPARSSTSQKPSVLSVIGANATFIGGMQSWSRELAVHLDRLGWNSIICSTTEPSEGLRAFLDLPNVSFEVLDEPWRVALAPVRGLREILRRRRPEILHLHFTGFVGFYPWLAKAYGVKRVFFTDHASRPEGFVPTRSPLWKRAATRVVNAPINEVFCVSDYGHRALEALDVFPAERIRTIYNSVDFARFDAAVKDGAAFRQKHGIPQDRRLIAQVSWIVPDKGIDDLLEAARLVLAEFAGAHFVFIGEGDLRNTYTERARAAGIGDHVTWTGLVRDPLNEGAFASADIVCQMSRWEEVFGWVLVEAMAHAKPVVATRVGGIPEVVSDGESGLLATRRDPRDMADKILTLLRDPAMCERMGRRGREIAKAKFDLPQNVSRVIKSYGIGG